MESQLLVYLIYLCIPGFLQILRKHRIRIYLWVLNILAWTEIKQCEVSLQETEPEGFVNIQQKFKGDMASLHEIQDELLITTFVALFKV